jgi:site-specific DNA-methyltransferase (cytosine-N4-specific)
MVSYLAQEFFWYNTARIPGPAEWVTVKRIRVKDAVEMVWWFSKTKHPKACNKNVLVPYSPSMLSLFKNGYNAGVRPSGHDVSKKWWSKNHGGAIPPNFLQIPDGEDEPAGASNALRFPNTEANTLYQRRCKERGFKPHPARFPAALPEFFIKMLTDEGDIVLDPFAGSNVTGFACEYLERKWLSVDLDEDFVRTSAFRFEGRILEANLSIPKPNAKS